MPYAPFDPTKAVTFDLASGQVHLQDTQTNLFVPAGAIEALCKAAGDEPTRRFGRAIGEPMGKRVAARLQSPENSGATILSTPIEGFAEHLGGEFALAGLGALTLERWGRALVFVLDEHGAPPAVVASVIEGAIEAATGRTTRCLGIMQEAKKARFLVISAITAERVQTWLAEGASWGDVLVKLHAAQPAPQPRGDA